MVYMRQAKSIAGIAIFVLAATLSGAPNKAWAQTDQPESVDWLCSNEKFGNLSEQEWEFAAVACRRLGRLGGAERTSALLELLENDSPLVRAHAARALVELDDRALPPILAAIARNIAQSTLQDNKPKRSLASLAWILAHVKTNPGDQLFRMALISPGGEANPIWVLMANVLKERPDSSTTLGQMLKSGDPRAVTTALAALRLGGSCPHALIAALIERVERNKDTRPIPILGLVRSPEHDRLTLWSLHSDSLQIRVAATEALGNEPADLSTLMVLSLDKEKPVSESALNTLGAMKSLDGGQISQLIMRMQDTPSIRSAGARALLASRANFELSSDLTDAIAAIVANEIQVGTKSETVRRLRELISAKNLPAKRNVDSLLAIVSDKATVMQSRVDAAIWSTLLGQPGTAELDTALESLLDEMPMAQIPAFLSELGKGPNLSTVSYLKWAADSGIPRRVLFELEKDKSDAAVLALKERFQRSLIAATRSIIRTDPAWQSALTRLSGGQYFCLALDGLGAKLANSPEHDLALLADFVLDHCSPPGPLADQELNALFKGEAGENEAPKLSRVLERAVVASNGIDIALGLLNDRNLPLSAELADYLCFRAEKNRENRYSLLKLIANLSWQKVNAMAESCPAVFRGSPDLAIELLARLGSTTDTAPDLTSGMAWLELALQSFGKPADQARAKPLLVKLASHSSSVLRRIAFSCLGRIGMIDPQLSALLVSGTKDPDYMVALAAAKASMLLGDSASEELAYTVLSNLELPQILKDFEEDYVGLAAEVGTTAGGMATQPDLPSFPWPPPRDGLVAVFQDNPPLSLLGTPETTLGKVLSRLEKGIYRADSNFTWRLWHVPGGFALMTRIEQVDDQGVPLEGQYRWWTTRRPPTNPLDFLVRLLTAPKGYYRLVVFVVSDVPLVGTSSGSPPSFEAGAVTLPARLSNAKLGDKQVYAIVYSFQKRDGASHAQPWKLVSAPNHLKKMGLLDALVN